MKNNGFTLAEILVTLAVIGVVAALAIPTLMQNTNDAQYKTAWKKAYSTISQAVLKIRAENGNPLATNLTDTELRNAFKEQLNIIKDCPSNVLGNCYPDIIKLPSSTQTATDYCGDTNCGGVITADGMSFVFDSRSTLVPPKYFILVDTNGLKPPNSCGKDIFGITITEGMKLTPSSMSGLCPTNAIDWLKES